MSLFVHILRDPDEGSLAHLQAQLHPSIHLTLGPDIPSRKEVDILVGGRPQRKQLNACAHLRALIIPFAGIPEDTRNLMMDYPHITVHNLHYNAAATSEVALALLLAAAKFLLPIDRAFRSHDWRPRYQPNQSVLLEGKRALVLGYGEIGKRVARGCLGLGMHTRAVRRDPSKGGSAPEVEVHSSKKLDRLLPETDVLIICLPLTSETKGLIDQHELNLLPEGAILVNVGRGPIVNESALFHALKVGKLCAAGLDVWYNYPEDESSRSRTAPSQFPFHELDNVVMSPHRAGGAKGRELRRMDALAEILNATVHGEPMPNRVDITLGY
jgi:phosphoglycerate dehydrogenase-like enzyme